jgi:polyhydroxyalkanoate synthesis regulator phasin
MAEPASCGRDRVTEKERIHDRDHDRSTLEQLILAALGAVAMTGERADRLADDLAELGGIRRDEARARIEELVSRWRGDAVRLREQAGSTVEKLGRDFGLVSRTEYEELELRLAQLEHRLRLLEDSK